MIDWSSETPLLPGVHRVTFYVMGPCDKQLVRAARPWYFTVARQ